MNDNARATVFVTGADGFLGGELVKVLVRRGHQVVALTPSVENATDLRRTGAIPVIGDLLTPGRWQDEVAADWVFHLPPSPGDRWSLFRNRTADETRTRLSLDASLLDAVTAGASRRVVYVADMHGYGAAGPWPITEDEPLRPSSSGSWVVPVFDRLDGYILAGTSIVTAIPGCVYGNGAWFRTFVAEPVMAGKPVLQFGKAGPLVSPIHVHDCARALVHLAEHGEAGGRYFLANNEPIRLPEFARTFARLTKRRLRVWRLPAAAARLVPPVTHSRYPEADAVFSNIRLRGIGFRFEYPTLDQGIQDVLGSFYEHTSRDR